MPTNDHLWTDEDAARWLQVAPATMVNIRRRKEIPFIMIAHKARYNPEDVRAYAERNRRPAKCSSCGDEADIEPEPIRLPKDASSDFPRYVSELDEQEPKPPGWSQRKHKLHI